VEETRRGSPPKSKHVHSLHLAKIFTAHTRTIRKFLSKPNLMAKSHSLRSSFTASNRSKCLFSPRPSALFKKNGREGWFPFANAGWDPYHANVLGKQTPTWTGHPNHTHKYDAH